jgi:hypothetical protein
MANNSNEYLDQERGRGRSYNHPGRGGFNGRQGNYGNQRGYNSSAYGAETWTFYNKDEAKAFHEWRKGWLEQKEVDRAKVLVTAMEKMIEKKFSKKDKKSKRKEKKKRRENSDSDEYSESDSDSTSDTITESSSDEEKSKKRFNSRGARSRRSSRSKREKSKSKKSTDKIIEHKEQEDTLKEVLHRLDRMERENSRLQGVIREQELQLRGRSRTQRVRIESRENSKQSEKNKVQPMQEEQEEDIMDLTEDGEKEKENDSVELKEIRKQFEGKEGTKALKQFCKENKIKIGRKEEMLMAVYALQNSDAQKS